MLRNVKLARRARQLHAIQDTKWKIVEIHHKVTTLRRQLSEWANWYCIPEDFGELTWLCMPSPIASRVRAKADSMFAPWRSCQVPGYDVHGPRQAGLHAGSTGVDIHIKGNVASHSGMFSVRQFEELDMNNLRRIQGAPRTRLVQFCNVYSGLVRSSECGVNCVPMVADHYMQTRRAGIVRASTQAVATDVAVAEAEVQCAVGGACDNREYVRPPCTSWLVVSAKCLAWRCRMGMLCTA